MDVEHIFKTLLEKANAGKEHVAALKGFGFQRTLGQGGMGAVCLIHHPKQGDRALKIMLPQAAADPTSRSLFLREVENTRVLRHPNVVSLYDAGQDGDVFFFTLEYCDRGSVFDLMRRSPGGRLPVGEAVGIVLQALDGLHYAHTVHLPPTEAGARPRESRGLVHRDLKPQNLFLSSAGAGLVTRVGDYGLAKAFELAGLSDHTVTGGVGGTPVFMPRLQVENYKYAGPEVDVWAMAASLYNMISGSYPRDFPPDRDVLEVVLSDDVVPIRKRIHTVPDRLAQVIDGALDEQGSPRYPTAIALRQALHKAVS